jgi:putative FmdB family regulatory protein
MPIYEYECQKCKAHTEVFQKITDKPRTRCPKCKGRLEKLMSASAIRFKGSGWYVTDYAAKGKPSDSGEEKTSSSSDTVTSKPAATTEAAKTRDKGAKKPAASESAPSTKSSGN